MGETQNKAIVTNTFNNNNDNVFKGSDTIVSRGRAREIESQGQRAPLACRDPHHHFLVKWKPPPLMLTFI